LSEELVSASVDRDVNNSRDDDISVDVHLKVGKSDQVEVDVNVSVDLEQVQSTQVNGLRARVREAVDSMESKLDRQKRKQVNVDVVEDGAQSVCETFLVGSSFGQRKTTEETVKEGKVVSDSEQATITTEQVVKIEFRKVEDVGGAVNDFVENFNSSSDQEDISSDVNSEE